jgi:uncharacterized protein YjbI with pentapeptide repeats
MGFAWWDADVPDRDSPMNTKLGTILAALAIGFAVLAGAQTAQAANPTAVASIRAGHHDCKGCNLSGADLTNTCVKHGDLEGADFDHANAKLMCMSFADFKHASFVDTDLSGANLTHSDLTGANVAGATFNIATIKGTNLAHTKGLTQAQLNSACGDKDTKVPPGFTVKVCS